MTDLDESCMREGCGRPEHKAGLCRGHYARKLRGDTSDSPLDDTLTPWERVVEAAIALADADCEEDYRASKARLRGAMTAWLRRPKRDGVSRRRRLRRGARSTPCV